VEQQVSLALALVFVQDIVHALVSILCVAVYSVESFSQSQLALAGSRRSDRWLACPFTIAACTAELKRAAQGKEE
jgi:hypothetical protein